MNSFLVARASRKWKFRLVLTGCGQAAPMGAMAASAGGFEAEAAKAKNPFSGLTAKVDPTAVLCPCVSVTATNDAKLKIVVATEDGKLDTVTVNRSAIVKGGKLFLGDKGDGKGANGFLLEAVTEATDAAGKRRASFLTLLGKLAVGLKAAKTEKKEDAKVVDEVAAALKAFVKDEKAAAPKADKAVEETDE
jgi:hypothetical protein